MTDATTPPLSPNVQYANRGLLPKGLQDQLPPDAEREARVLEGLMHLLGQWGFDRVKPPLLEFENTLLASAPAKLRRRSFRVVDPLSRETLVLRSDMTGQVARLAATRLAEAARPLRLSYGGQVVRVSGSDLRPERQFTQVGAEIIGLNDREVGAAMAQATSLAAQGLTKSGIDTIVIDLVLPDLIPRVVKRYGHTLSTALLGAIAARDPAMLASQACDQCRDTLTHIMDAGGPWQESLQNLRRLDGLLTPTEMDLVERVATSMEARHSNVIVTLDPAEMRGFEYHHRLGFVLFAPGVRGELGRGGGYCSDGGEPSVGFTLYCDSLVRALGPQPSPPYLFVPRAHADAAQGLVDSGHRVRVQLDDEEDARILKSKAIDLGCQAIWDGDKVVTLTAAHDGS